MEQKKILYMGIDLTDEQAMVSLFGRGMEEPETIMTGASKERYGIPVAMYLAWGRSIAAKGESSG